MGDTGVGIAADDDSRIFDDFIQVGNPERDRRKGMGLGLAIARRSARLLGGEIGVVSHVGRGSVFHMMQPFADADLVIHRSVAAPADPLAGVRVLAVVDDPEVREAIAMLLRQWNVAVDVGYTVVHSDYRLPGAMTGLDLVARLKTIAGGRLNACIATGDLDPSLVAAAGIDLIHKPIQPAQLRALIAHLATGGDVKS